MMVLAVKSKERGQPLGAKKLIQGGKHSNSMSSSTSNSTKADDATSSMPLKSSSQPSSPKIPLLSLRRPVSTDSFSPASNPAARRNHVRSISSSSLATTLNSASTARRLAPRSSLSNLQSSSTAKTSPSSTNFPPVRVVIEPTLQELMQEEERAVKRFKALNPAARRHSTEAIYARSLPMNGSRVTHYDVTPPDGDDGEQAHELARTNEFSSLWNLNPPQSAILHPPLYGRPGPSPSPDIFATLLQPLLSLSRPPSPALHSNKTPTENADDSVNTATSSSPKIAASTVSLASRSASSLPAHFPPRAKTDPAPTVESQGFVLYLGSLIAWLAFLVWSLFPDALLEKLGLGWYPNREWALLVSGWTIILGFFVYFGYIALNFYITPELDSLQTLTDYQASILPYDAQSNAAHPLLVNSIHLPMDAVPPLHDLPIGIVNRVTLGDFRRRRPQPEPVTETTDTRN